MKKNLTIQNQISNFLIERNQKAVCHAQEVKYVVPALWGYVQQFGKNIQTKFNNNEPYGNIVWFDLNDIPYCLAYSHKSKKIELRDRSQRGESIMNFDNSTTIEEIFAIFSVLSQNLEPAIV